MGEGFKLEELKKEEAIHLIGIGGAGMSAIATVLLQMGYEVEGSDIKESPNVRRLRRLGAVVGIGHRSENVGAASVVVKSSAISGGNPELVESRRRGIPVIARAEMLAEIMSTRSGIAIAGTHGKTTTSSLVTQMLLGCGADPSFLIGGELNEMGGNAHYGQGKYLVAEADESDGSLLSLRPSAIILTNIDGDHLDYFENIEHTAKVFREFLGLLPPHGFAVVCGDNPAAHEVGLGFQSAGGRAYFYGRSSENDYRLEGENTGAEGSAFAASFRGDVLGEVRMMIPGLHNMYNALAALAVGHQLEFPLEMVIDGLGCFQGVRRRFETIGVSDGIQVMDDYAHHPTEIEAVLDLARSVTSSRVVVVFQPHRYSRTRLLAGEFAACFEEADLVIVTDVYGAGEDPEPGVTGRLVSDGILEKEPEKPVLYVPLRAELARETVSLLQPGDFVITMGAGDVTQCAREILELLEEGNR